MTSSTTPGLVGGVWGHQGSHAKLAGGGVVKMMVTAELNPSQLEAVQQTEGL